MKRYFVLVVVLAFAVSCFAFPASASNLNYDSWFDAFDYIIDDHLMFGLGWTNNVSKAFELPFSVPMFYFEFLVYDYWLMYDDYGIDLTFYLFDEDDNEIACESVYLGDGLYRVFGFSGNPDYLNFYGIYVELSQEFASPEFYVHNFYINTVPSELTEIEGYCNIATPAYERTIHYVPTDEVNHRQWVGSNDYTDPYLMLELRTDEWKKYDYVDFTLFLDCYSVTSIAAYFDGQLVPLEYGYLDNSYTGVKGFTFTLRLDLRGLDRSVDSYPAIQINGQETPEQVNSVAVLSIVGGLSSEPDDSDVFWLKRIFVRLGDLMGGPVNPAEQFDYEVDSARKQFDSLEEDLNSVTSPVLDDVSGDVSDFVSVDDLLLASNGIGELIENPIILSVFSMSLILCLASFIFFGKK